MLFIQTQDENELINLDHMSILRDDKKIYAHCTYVNEDQKKVLLGMYRDSDDSLYVMKQINNFIYDAQRDPSTPKVYEMPTSSYLAKSRQFK